MQSLTDVTKKLSISGSGVFATAMSSLVEIFYFKLNDILISV